MVAAGITFEGTTKKDIRCELVDGIFEDVKEINENKTIQKSIRLFNGSERKCWKPLHKKRLQ